jgi:hypothetical protein
MLPQSLVGDEFYTTGFEIGVMAGLDPAIHVFLASRNKDVDARQRRQVYAICASLTAGRA